MTRALMVATTAILLSCSLGYAQQIRSENHDRLRRETPS
jgi:hypothetical protein